MHLPAELSCVNLNPSDITPESIFMCVSPCPWRGTIPSAGTSPDSSIPSVLRYMSTTLSMPDPVGQVRSPSPHAVVCEWNVYDSSVVTLAWC